MGLLTHLSSLFSIGGNGDSNYFDLKKSFGG
jgi:hypothetical protein